MASQQPAIGPAMTEPTEIGNRSFLWLKDAFGRMLGPLKSQLSQDENPRQGSSRPRSHLRKRGSRRNKKSQKTVDLTGDLAYESAVPAGVTAAIAATATTPAIAPPSVPPSATPPAPTHTGTGLSTAGPARTETTSTSSGPSSTPSRIGSLTSSSTSSSIGKTFATPPPPPRTGPLTKAGNILNDLLGSLRKPKSDSNSLSSPHGTAHQPSMQYGHDFGGQLPPSKGLVSLDTGMMPPVALSPVEEAPETPLDEVIDAMNKREVVKSVSTSPATGTPAVSTAAIPSPPKTIWITEFAKIWETKTLPLLEKSLEIMYGGDYVISILNCKQPGHRVAAIVTAEELPQERESLEESLKTLPPYFYDRIRLSYHVGTIKPCVNRSPSEDQETGPSSPGIVKEDTFNTVSSENTLAENRARYDDPSMGDSAGRRDCKSSAVTLGPMVRLRGIKAWLVSWHAFDDESPDFSNYDHKDNQPLPNLYLTHPGPRDDPEGQTLGKVVAFSGPMLTASRLSPRMKKLCEDKLPETPSVGTDWALVSADSFVAYNQASTSAATCLAYFPNRLRTVPAGREFEEYMEPVTEIVGDEFDIRGRLVYSTGRSSGLTYARVAVAPAVLKRGNQRSREWFLEPDPRVLEDLNLVDENKNQWNNRGLGISGDSGAPIVDFYDGKLIGMVWGRLDPAGDDIRQALFTHIADIFDDVEDRYPQLGRPDLHLQLPCEPMTVPLPWLKNDEETSGSSDVNHADAEGSDKRAGRDGILHKLGAGIAEEQQGHRSSLPSVRLSRASSVFTRVPSQRSSSKVSSKKTDFEDASPTDRIQNGSLTKVEENIMCVATRSPASPERPAHLRAEPKRIRTPVMQSINSAA